MKKILNSLWDKISHVFDIFNSVRIIDNPAINLALKIGILLVAFLIIKAVFKSFFGSSAQPPKPTGTPPKPANTTPKPTSTPPKPANTTPKPLNTPPKPISTPAPKTIDECASQDDLKFQMDKAEEEIISTIQKNKQQIADTLKKANQDIDLSWLDSCNRILRIANTLDHNLTYYAHKNLEMSKFHYYTHLHFRSMIAADFVHREYKKIDQSFTEINRFIVRMKPTPTFYGDYKNFIHSQKNQIKSIRNLSLNRLHSMNHQTEILRDKIGKECGKRGYEWWLERKKHDK